MTHEEAQHLAAIAEQLAPGALAFVNVARGAFGADSLTALPAGSPFTVHPLKIALHPCGVIAVYPDTLDVLRTHAPRLNRAWSPFGTPELDPSPGDDDCVFVALPEGLREWMFAFDTAAALVRAAEEAA